jgi:chromosome partitioning protein
MIFAISNQKGGVTKTTLAVTLSYTLAQLKNKRVLLVDLDPQKHSTAMYLPQYTRLDKEETLYSPLNDQTPLVLHATRIPNLRVAASHISLSRTEGNLKDEVGGHNRLKEILVQHKKDFDAILIDCPPSLGYLLVNALAAADQIIIPISHQGFEEDGLADLLDTIGKVRKHYNPDLTIGGFLQTLTSPTKLSKTFKQELLKKYNELVFLASTPRAIAVPEAHSKKLIIFEYAQKPRVSKTKTQAITNAYRKFTDEIISKFKI